MSVEKTQRKRNKHVTMQKLGITLIAVIAALEIDVGIVVTAQQSLRMEQEIMSDAPSSSTSDAPSASPIRVLEPPGEKSPKGDKGMMMSMTKPKGVVKTKGTAAPTVGIVTDPAPNVGKSKAKVGKTENKGMMKSSKSDFRN
jgi:hypothetical protein